MTGKYSPATCPMPGCVAGLHVMWAASGPLYVSDLFLTALDPPREVPCIESHSATRSWSVECEVGHVVLVPTEHAGCDCDEDDCGCDVDRDENLRQSRESDVCRLESLFTRMMGR